jgi:large subunit ribosomal protein L9
MEVILKQDISGLGYKNDIVKVKAGYGNNYLIPNGFALIANESNRRLINENVRQMAHKAEKLKQDAQALASRVGDFVVEIKTKAGESGKIFGAVTALQISDVLKANGLDIDRKKVILKDNPKQVGNYTAVLDLHKEVKHEIKVVVSAE